MLKIVKKYISFDKPEDKHMEEKIAKCKNIDEVVKTFVDNKWGISHSIIKDMINDVKNTTNVNEVKQEITKKAFEKLNDESKALYEYNEEKDKYILLEN